MAIAYFYGIKLPLELLTLSLDEPVQLTQPAHFLGAMSLSLSGEIP